MTLWRIPYISRCFWKRVGFSLWEVKTVGKFGPSISLNALDRTGKGLHQMIYKLSGEIGTVPIKCQGEYSSMAVYWKSCFPITCVFSNR